MTRKNRSHSVRSNPNLLNLDSLNLSEIAKLANHEVTCELNRMERNARKTAQDRCRRNESISPKEQ